jgi:hypothetical protein
VQCAAQSCEFLVASSGQSVSLQAIPDSGARFLGWSGACDGTDVACSLPLTRDVAIATRFGRPIRIATSALRSALSASAYTDTLHADGGVDSITWSLTAGALPAGLTLASATGVVSGTPVNAEVTTVIVSAQSDELAATRELTLEVEAPLKITSSATRPASLLGASYADTLRATGGSVQGTTWRVAGGSLPSGLTLGATGTLTGTPEGAGSVSATLVAESGSQRLEQSFTWRVLSAFAILADSVRPQGVMGAAYRDSLTATDGVPGVHWLIASGPLPTGLTLEENTGLISGIPEATGDFFFAVEARAATANAGEWRTTRSFALSLRAPQVASSAVMDHMAGVHPLPADLLRYIDLLGNRNSRLDVGDVAAWLEATGQLGTPAASALLSADHWRLP